MRTRGTIPVHPISYNVKLVLLIGLLIAVAITIIAISSPQTRFGYAQNLTRNTYYQFPSGCYLVPIRCPQCQPGRACPEYQCLSQLICPSGTPTLSPSPSVQSCTPQGTCTYRRQCPAGTYCTGMPLNQCLPVGCKSFVE